MMPEQFFLQPNPCPWLEALQENKGGRKSSTGGWSILTAWSLPPVFRSGACLYPRDCSLLRLFEVSGLGTVV